jgi:hypothetical protein
MKQNNIIASGVRLGRVIGKANPRLHGFLKRKYHDLRYRLNDRKRGRNYVIFWNGKRDRKSVGIYLRGGCDVVAAFDCEPLIRSDLDGTCAIYKTGVGAPGSHSSILLQTLENYPRQVIEPALKYLELKPAYFRPSLFEPTFAVPGITGLETYPKSVVILSNGPDAIRTLYRHKEHGYLIDPGGWWLNQDMSRVLENTESVDWFRKNFAKVGRLSVEESMNNLERIILEIRARTGAYVLVFNTLAVDPGSNIYNYQFVLKSNELRRREFNLGLVELSRKIDFSIVDVDRILKLEGVREQLDFAHWPKDRFGPVAVEIHRILRDREIL